MVSASRARGVKSRGGEGGIARRDGDERMRMSSDEKEKRRDGGEVYYG